MSSISPKSCKKKKKVAFHEKEIVCLVETTVVTKTHFVFQLNAGLLDAFAPLLPLPRPRPAPQSSTPTPRSLEPSH